MAEHLHSRQLFRGATLSICDVACRPHCSDCGGDEWADAHEVVFPRTGVFVKHAGQESVVADSNKVLFLNRHEPYRISHPVLCGDDCTVLTFAPDALIDVLSLYDPAARDRPDRVFHFGHSLLKPDALPFLHRLRRYLCGSACDDMAVEEFALELLDSVVRHAYHVRGRQRARVRPATALAHRESADATRTFLAARFRSRLTLDDVAGSVHRSRFHLARLFRQETGISIHEYQNRLRLAEALERLADGEGDLTQLALDLGYSSHSHFSSAFRRSFGTAPSVFRRTATVELLREMSTNLTA